jgi:DNA-binding transcriptional LysR family regulator
MNINDMQALIAVVEEGSIAQAAGRLGLTQPAVTRRIQRLEAELSAILLDREQKPSLPTRDGLNAYRACVEVIRATNELRNQVGSAQPRELRIGLSHALSEKLIGCIFRLCRKAHEDVSAEFSSRRSIELRELLGAGRLDMALILLPPGERPEAKENPIPLGHEDMVVVAPARFKLATRCRLADIAALPWVINPTGCGFRMVLESELRKSGKTLKVAASIWSQNLQRELIQDGAGLGLLPKSAFSGGRREHGLRPLEVIDFDASLDTWLIHKTQLRGIERIAGTIAQTVAQEFERSRVGPPAERQLQPP